MSWRKALTCSAGFLFALVIVCPDSARAAKISGIISATLAITENSELAGNVTFRFTGAPCLSVSSLHVPPDLNAYTIICTRIIIFQTPLAS